LPIEIKDVSFSYLDQPVLKNVSAIFEEGLVHLLLGATGCGKTTLALLMAGLARPDGGSVLVDGCDPASRSFERRTLQLAFQFPEVQIFESSVASEIEYGLKNFGFSPEDAARWRSWAMECVGLSGDLLEREPASLSFGERRKLALASVVALRPKYLLLDEPLAGLDWHGRRHLVETIQRLKGEGLTTVILTHEADLVSEIGDAVALFDRTDSSDSGDRDGRGDSGTMVGPMPPEEFLNSSQAAPDLLPDYVQAVRKIRGNIARAAALPRAIDEIVGLLT